MDSHLRTTHILETAKLSGASLAGIANVASLQNALSHHSYGQVEFSSEAKSVLILALVHNEDEPKLDWWGVEEGTLGNRRLHQVSTSLKLWLNAEYQVQAQPLPYHVEEGGIFLKDAAVLAGLGILGANNLLITPEFGPRVRLRALFLNRDLDPTGPIVFSPCDGCSMPCKLACPQNAFSSGSYTKDLCWKQMQEDQVNRILVTHTMQEDSPRVWIKYCRSCELTCPVGKRGNPPLTRPGRGIHP